MKPDIKDMMTEVKSVLEDLTAIYLDADRDSINVVYLNMNPVEEDYYDWSLDPDYGVKGEQIEYYYKFGVRLGEEWQPIEMIWQHIEGHEYGGYADRVMTMEKFESLFEQKKSDPCSVWHCRKNK